MIDKKLASMIDHTILKADAAAAQIEKLCEEAITYGFCSVCITPARVALAARCLKGSPVLVCTVAGFPLGASTLQSKRAEAIEAAQLGAREIDMVINVGALKDNRDQLVEDEIRAVVQGVEGSAIVKVIIETCLLTRDEIVRVCGLCKNAGAHFVKTSTGMSSAGATVEHVRLMRSIVGASMGVKAAGGIRDRATADAMIAAGASRIGCSASIAIVTASV